VLSRKLAFEDALESGFLERESFLAATDPGVLSQIVDKWENIYGRTRNKERFKFSAWSSALMLSQQAKRYSDATGEEPELTRLKIMALISQVPHGSGDALSDLASLSPRGAWNIVTAFTTSLIDSTLQQRE
jgi:hypothetical protein